MNFCSCKEWKSIKDAHGGLFAWQPPYGWVLSWVEVTQEKGYSYLHRYGIKVNFCPMCGKPLTNLKEPF